MPLAFPKLVMLDTSTLGKISLDYWSGDGAIRAKARSLLGELKSRGIFVALTMTHVLELFRHENEQVSRSRRKFLSALPLIAWLRPYDRSWFPGGIPDLLLRELHCVVHGEANNWDRVVEQVRDDLWETGTGAEMFGQGEEVWEAVAAEGLYAKQREQYIASVVRTDPCFIKPIKIKDAITSNYRSKEERAEFLNQFAAMMHSQLTRHGDKRLGDPRQIALDFAQNTAEQLEAIDSLAGNPITGLLEYFGVPIDLISDDMTIEEVAELAVYVEQLKTLQGKLRPRAVVSIRNVPLGTLPSHTLERNLRAVQQRQLRVSGSDLGDAHLVPLAQYCDAVELDKRTFEYLTQISRHNSYLARLKRRLTRATDYSELPQVIGPPCLWYSCSLLRC